MTDIREVPPVPVGIPVSRSDPFAPADELGRLRAHRPISRMTFPDGHLGWLVTSHSAVRAVLSDTRFSSRAEIARSPIATPRGQRPIEEIPPGLFTRMDPPEHTRIRRLLTGEFTVRRMQQLVPRIEQIAEEHLDAMRRQGPPVDLVTAFARPIPSLVICELLGVPYEDRDRFQRDSTVLLDLSASQEDVRAAFTSLQEYLGELVRAKRAEPTDDLLGGLAAGDGLTEAELTTVALTLLVAGHETTANMLSLGPFALLRHPDVLATLRADESLMDGAVEELLRYLSIIHIGPVRTAVEDVELEGHLIKSGDSVVVSLPSANRDAGHFENPDTLDVTRQVHGHVAFGHGVHQCLGQQLARMEMRVGLAALLRRFPTLRLAVPADDVPLGTNAAIYGVLRLPVTWEE